MCYDRISLWLYLRAGRQNKDISVEFLCHAVEGSELAQEVYEEFFRDNNFDCSCQDLRLFLTTSTTRFNFQNNLVPTTTNHGYLKFEKIPWIRKVKISIFNDSFNRNSSEHLAHLLKCPRLQQVGITIIGLDGDFDNISPLHRTVEAIAGVCKKIRNKIGNGLIIKMQKARTEDMISSPGPEDVSWIWEEPSEKAKARVGTGLWTWRDRIQLLMVERQCNQKASRALTSGTL